jgi:hypothetical protein
MHPEKERGRDGGDRPTPQRKLSAANRIANHVGRALFIASAKGWFPIRLGAYLASMVRWPRV